MNEKAIPIRPLTVRGVFGISKKIISERFWGLMGYVGIYVLIDVALCALAALPAVMAAVSGDESGFGIAAGILLTVLLSLAAALLIALLFKPMFEGTLYQELSARIFGEGSGCARMLRRTGYSLRRFFTTELCLIVCNIGIGIISSIAVSMLSGVAGLAGAAGILSLLPSVATPSTFIPGALSFGALGTAGVWLIVISCAMVAASLCIELAGQCFITFAYPAAVNENERNFNAVGRSMKLVFKRFWRVFLCRLIVGLVFTAVTVILAGLLVLTALLMDGRLAAGLGVAIIVALSLIILLAAMAYSLFDSAVNTVLYFDTRVRLEGEDWLKPNGEAENGGQANGAPAGDAPDYNAPNYGAPGYDAANYDAPAGDRPERGGNGQDIG